MEMLTGGYYKATIHRVIQPPADQRNLERLGVFYFAMPDDDVKLVPFTSRVNPVWVDRKFKDEDAPTMEVHRRGRTAAYGKTVLKKVEGVSDEKDEGKEGFGVEEEVINGVVIRHYT